MVAQIADKLSILYCKMADKERSKLLQRQYGIMDCVIEAQTDVDLALKIDVLEHFNQFDTLADLPCLKKILNGT